MFRGQQYDSKSGAYGSVIAGGGVRLGDAENNFEVVRGMDATTSLGSGATTMEGITIMGANGGIDALLAGVGLSGGLYRQDDGRWGVYFGAGPSFLGAHSAAGFGFGLWASAQAALERTWKGGASPKPVCSK